MTSCSTNELNLRTDLATDKEVLSIVLEDIRMEEELVGKSAAIWGVGRTVNNKQLKGLKEISGLRINKPWPYSHEYVEKVITINEIQNLNGEYKVTFRVYNSPIIDWEWKTQKRRDVMVVLDSKLNIIKWTSEEIEFKGIMKRVKK